MKLRLLLVWSLGQASGSGSLGPNASLPRAGGGKSLEGHLHPGHDADSPVHAEHYVPRQEGDLWTFGRAHAVLRHAQQAKEGDARHVARLVEDFCQEHQLERGVIAPDEVLAAAVKAAAAAQQLTLRPASSREALLAPARPASGAETRGLRILVLSSGWGQVELRFLPHLLRFDGDHEVVSVEADPHLSDVGAQLLRHALGQRQVVRHLPLLPGEETTLPELLETLREVYELPVFDLVLLGGSDGASCAAQAQDLVTARVLRSDGLVLAILEDAQRYLQELAERGDFMSQVQEISGSHSAVISTVSEQTEL